ncbi:hypothetical protein HOF56_01125 [Candidatus Peribacteria bacterium]|nr:hypothetical protein [Candidatus Peribacteria bacterium]MBT4020927.1 hypothetical protein [Candidatus Peribacteria bacterium]MBT4240485.1 hypothetical protein [Candidatus Peribacteria bacterium]MBT4474369.1 hypothetical protein [Candidatus Peribacteria bacterium]
MEQLEAPETPEVRDLLTEFVNADDDRQRAIATQFRKLAKANGTIEEVLAAINELHFPEEDREHKDLETVISEVNTALGNALD